MKKLALFAAAFAALMSTAAAGSAAPGATATLGPPTVTLHFLEIQTGFVSTGPEGRRPQFGDRFSFHSEFYKWRNGKRGAHLGHADASGIALTHTMQVTGVAWLPGGTLTVVGMEPNRPVTTLAVVGGTGIYATARGQVTFHSLGGPNSGRAADTVKLWL